MSFEREEIDQGPWRGPAWDRLVARVEENARVYAKRFPQAPRGPVGPFDSVGPASAIREHGHFQRERL